MVQSLEDARLRRDAAPIPRVPPHNLEAEQSLLGAMLLSQEAIGDAAGTVVAENFYKPAHQHVFRAILSLNASGQPADVVTVAEELRRREVLETVGGPASLVALQGQTPAIGNAEHYASIISENARLRRLIGVGAEIVELGYSLPDSVTEAINLAESLVYQVADGHVASTVSVLSDLVEAAMADLERLYEAGSELTGVPTGFVELDRILLGLQQEALLVLGARPAMGKSALALNIAANVAIRHHLPVLFFSLEMGAVELTKRLLAAEARINARLMRSGNLKPDDWSRFSRAMGQVGDAPLYIDENPALTLVEVRAKARRLASQLRAPGSDEGQLGLIVIDYLQLMTGNMRAENRQVEVAEMSRGLKVLARELKVPILALSQLSRGVEQRTDKRPQLSDLRESGAIEQDADVVMFIHRDEQLNPDNIESRGLAELLVAKHRSGPTGKVELVFHKDYTLFTNLARDD